MSKERRKKRKEGIKFECKWEESEKNLVELWVGVWKCERGEEDGEKEEKIRTESGLTASKARFLLNFCFLVFFYLS